MRTTAPPAAGSVRGSTTTSTPAGSAAPPLPAGVSGCFGSLTARWSVSSPRALTARRWTLGSASGPTSSPAGTDAVRSVCETPDGERCRRAAYGRTACTVRRGALETAPRPSARRTPRRRRRSGAARASRCATPCAARCASAAAASSLTEFLERLREDGLLVRERHSERNVGEITGYAVASPHSADANGTPIYYGVGKLARRPHAAQAVVPLGGRGTGEGADTSARSPGAEADSSRSTGSTPVPDAAAGGRGSIGGEDRHPLTPGERTRIWERATARPRPAPSSRSRPASAPIPTPRRTRPGPPRTSCPRGRPGRRGPVRWAADRRRR